MTIEASAPQPDETPTEADFVAEAVTHVDSVPEVTPSKDAPEKPLSMIALQGPGGRERSLRNQQFTGWKPPVVKPSGPNPSSNPSTKNEPHPDKVAYDEAFSAIVEHQRDDPMFHPEGS